MKKIEEKDVSAKDVERAQKERQRAETRAKVKAETERQREEKRKSEEERNAVSERQKARAEEYKKTKRSEQMTFDEFERRLNSGENYDDLAKEYRQFESDQKMATPGGFASQPTTRELAEMAAAEHYGNPSNNSRMSGAVKAYQMLEGEARNILRQNNNGVIDPNDEYANDFINMYINALYSNPDVSLDDVRNTVQAMHNSNDTAAQVAAQKKQEEFLKAAQTDYYIDPVTGAPIEDYGLSNAPRRTFNDVMQSPRFNELMQTGWSAANPMPQVPNTGDPTLPYMNTGTESTGYTPTSDGYNHIR